MVNCNHPPKSSRYFDGALHQMMSEDLQLAGFSKRTVHGYLRAARQLADWAQSRPGRISERQGRQCFLYLKNAKHFAYGSIRIAFSGIKFFYTRTCKRDGETLATMKLQRAKTLPEVLAIDQVHAIIDPCRVQRIALFYWTAYSMGLRLEEARNLAVDDSSVTYTVRPSKSTSTVTRTVEGTAFVEGFAQHVLPSGFQKIRHYGWMSANSKTRLDEVKWLVWISLGWTFWLASGHAPQDQSLTAPLRCSDCGGELRVVDVTFDPIMCSDNRALAYFDSG